MRWRAFGDAMMNKGQATRARLLLWIHGVFVLRLLRKLIDRSRVVGSHSGRDVCNVHLIPRIIVRHHRWRALTRAGMVCVRGEDLMVWARREL